MGKAKTFKLCCDAGPAPLAAPMLKRSGHNRSESETMTSERQIAANRRNAVLSTGPRTDEGKNRSRFNALTHGLTACKGLLAGEDPEDYRLLQCSLIAEHRPRNTLELALLERIASVLWRLKRVPAFESALMAWLYACGRRKVSLGDPDHTYGCDEPPFQLSFGRTIENFLKPGLGDKLSRYEAGLQRQLCILLKELRDNQARRSGEAEGYGAAPGDAETG